MQTSIRKILISKNKIALKLSLITTHFTFAAMYTVPAIAADTSTATICTVTDTATATAVLLLLSIQDSSYENVIRIYKEIALAIIRLVDCQKPKRMSKC